MDRAVASPHVSSLPSCSSREEYSVAVHKHTSLHRWPPTQKFEEEKDAAGNIINPYGAPEAYAVLYTKCVNVDWSGRPGGVPSANGCIQSTFGAAYMMVILIEPLADLAVLAAAKTLSRYATSPIFYNRLHHPAV